MARVTDKCRTGIPGVPGLSRVVNSHAWGDAKAVERGYGPGTRTFPAPPSRSMPEFKIDQPPGKSYEGEIPTSSYLRGGNGNGKPRR